MTGANVIGGDRSSGRPGAWADVKTESLSAIEAAGYSYITLFLMQGYVEPMVEEKIADQRKQTPGETRPPRGGQGAGAKRELAQLQKDAVASAPCPMEDGYSGRLLFLPVKSMWVSAGINKVARREVEPRRRH
jgi:hypothetical protein